MLWFHKISLFIIITMGISKLEFDDYIHFMFGLTK